MLREGHILQFLQTRRPVCLRESARAGIKIGSQPPRGDQRSCGIDCLMRAEQVCLPVLLREFGEGFAMQGESISASCFSFFFTRPVALTEQKGSVALRGAFSDDARSCGSLGRGDDGGLAANDSCFFVCDCAEAGTEEGLMVEADGGDDGESNGWHDTGCIESSAKTDFEQEEVSSFAGVGFGEGEEGGGCCDFEIGDGMGVVGAFGFAQGVVEILFADGLVGELYALVESYEVRGGIAVAVPSVCVGDCLEESEAGSLTIRAGDLDDWREFFFGVSKTLEEALDSREREVYPPGMEFGEGSEEAFAFVILGECGVQVLAGRFGEGVFSSL